MPLSPDGWFDWCERVPGPADKVYSDRNSVKMYLPHSAVGYYGGWEGRLFSSARDAQGRYTDYAAASVHLWLPQASTEKPKQHYPIWASCWASGSRYPNTMGVAAENEGGFDPTNEPLTDWQVECNVRAIRELAALRQWLTVRRPIDENDVGAQLYEHGECIRWGSGSTSCPSNRIPWTTIIQRLEADMATLTYAEFLEFFKKAMKEQKLEPLNDAGVPQGAAYTAQRWFEGHRKHVADHPSATETAPHTHGFSGTTEQG